MRVPGLWSNQLPHFHVIIQHQPWCLLKSTDWLSPIFTADTTRNGSSCSTVSVENVHLGMTFRTKKTLQRSRNKHWKTDKEKNSGSGSNDWLIRMGLCWGLQEISDYWAHCVCTWPKTNLKLYPSPTKIQTPPLALVKFCFQDGSQCKQQFVRSEGLLRQE